MQCKEKEIKLIHETIRFHSMLTLQRFVSLNIFRGISVTFSSSLYLIKGLKTNQHCTLSPSNGNRFSLYIWFQYCFICRFLKRVICERNSISVTVVVVVRSYINFLVLIVCMRAISFKISSSLFPFRILYYFVHCCCNFIQPSVIWFLRNRLLLR